MFKAELDVDGILYEIRELAYEYGGYNAEDYAESLYQALVRVLDRKAYSEQPKTLFNAQKGA